VVFSSGYVLRVESFQVEDDQARAEVSLGVVWFPLSIVERVVANEVELTAEERRLPAMDLGSGASDGTDAALGTPDGEFIFEPALPEELDSPEPDPARSISGKVLNEAGETVEGIELTARAIRLFEEKEGVEETGQEPQAASDDDGSYRFERLPQGDYRIYSAATDRYAAAQTVVRTGVDFANLVVVEARELWVYGVATSNPGEPLEGVKVIPRGQTDKAVLTDFDGSYALEMNAAGRGRDHEVRFVLAGYREQALSLPASRVAGSEIRLDARLEPITSLATVSGRVTTRDGVPVSGERVSLRGEGSYHAVTNAAGEFSIPEVEAEANYRLSIRPRGPYRDHQERVWVGANGLEAKVVLEPLDYGTLSGQMMDMLGNPVPHFSLWLETKDVSAKRLMVTGDAAGRYAVTDVPTGALSFSTLANPRFTVSGPALSPRRPEERVDLILDWGSEEIRGRILDTEGNPVAATQVTLYWAHYHHGAHSRSVRHTAVAADGSFRFTQIGPGAHTVTVHAPGFKSTQVKAEFPGDLVVQLQANDQETALQGK